MDWLANLKSKKIEAVKKPRKNTPEYIRAYKQKHYIDNIDKYTQRNREASRQRSIELFEDRATEEELIKSIEEMSSDDIIYKMKYICDNTIVEPPVVHKKIKVTFM